MLAGLAIVLISAKLLAQNQFEERGLTIRPAIVEVDVEAENETSIVLANNSSSSIAVQATAEPFVTTDPLLNPAERNRYDISTWIELPVSSWVLERGEEIEVKLTIDPPEDPVPGDHFGQLAFRVVSGEIGDTSGAVVRPEAVALLFVSVGGQKHEGLELTQEVGKRFVLSGPITSTLTLINNGNVHLLVRPFLKIGDQSAVLQETLDTDVQVLTPGTAREITLSYDDGSLFARHKVWAEAFYGTPTTGKQTEAVEVIVVSPLLILGLLTITVLAAAYASGKTPGLGRLSYSASGKQRSKRAGGYHHPKTKSERKIIKSNK